MLFFAALGKNDPFQSSLSFHLNFDFTFPSGGLVSEEKYFVDQTGFSSIFSDNLGNVDTTKYSYRYFISGFEASLGYCLLDYFSVGLNFNYDIQEQAINWDDTKYKYNENSETMVTLSKIGPFIEYWFLNREIISLSVAVPLQYANGTLERLPILNRVVNESPSIENDFKILVKSAHRKIGVSGISIDPSVNLRFYIGDAFYGIIGLKYEFSQLYINKDYLTGYPSSLSNHAFGFKCGFGVTTNTFF